MPLNHGFDYRETLGPQADGETLVDWLARRRTHSSWREWRQRIEAGQVLLDDRPARPDDLLRSGQRLLWRRPPWDEPATLGEIDALFEDEELLAVAKPAGLPTLPGAGYLENTLLHRVRAREPRAVPLHRLGRWTSGIVLFARTQRARADLAAQWRRRSVRKRYRTLARGHAARDTFLVDVPIGPQPHPLLGTVHAASPAGKPAVSRVEQIEQRPDAFLCDVRIETGRPHQVRIHLAASGHPLVGDPLFPVGGVPAADCRALPGDPGYLLHAIELTLRHPRDGRRISIACEPPVELRRAFAP